MDKFSLAQKHYLHEADRQAALNASLATPLALVTALLTGTFTMLSSITLPLWWAEAALGVMCAIAIIAELTVITNLVRASVGYRYAHPATVTDHLAWYQERRSAGLSRFAADEALSDMLLSEYARCASVNARNNDVKAEYLEASRIYTVFAVVLLVIAAVPLLIVRADMEASFPPRAQVVHR